MKRFFSGSILIASVFLGLSHCSVSLLPVTGADGGTAQSPTTPQNPTTISRCQTNGADSCCTDADCKNPAEPVCKDATDRAPGTCVGRPHESSTD